MNSHHQTEISNGYACPMHPEVTGKKGDKCPKCGMELVALQKADEANKYDVNIGLPQTIKAGIPVDLSLTITKEGVNVPLDISHEMKMHLMVVSEDLAWFTHIHPEEQNDGTYTITESFPYGGKYLLFTDYKPTGASSLVDKQTIDVEGDTAANSLETAARLVSEVDGFTVTLRNGNALSTDNSQPLEIIVEKEGKQLQEQDLQQYLGASAHIVMISQTDKDFLHIHPVSNNHFPIYAETFIKKPGIYRMWVQFKIEGRVHTADMTVNVSQGEKKMNDHSSHGHHH